MGFLARFFGIGDRDEPEVYDADKEDELIAESELYTEAQPLTSTTVTLYPRDIKNVDTDALLEKITELPYEFRLYLDTRRAFANAFRFCGEGIADFESYEGGRSSEWSESYEYDDHSVTIDFRISRDSRDSYYVFTADIRIDED